MPPTDSDIDDDREDELDTDPVGLVEALRDSLDELSDHVEDLIDRLDEHPAEDKATFHVEGPPELVTSVLDQLKGDSSQMQTMLGTIASAMLAEGRRSTIPAPETAAPKRPRASIHLVFDSTPLGERGTSYSGEVAVRPIDGGPALFEATFNGTDPDRPAPSAPEPPPTPPGDPGSDKDEGELPS